MRAYFFSVLALLLTAQGIRADAQEIGTIRVAALDPNPAHGTPVTLFLNQVSTSIRFSHSLSGPLIGSINRTQLASGKSTAISADYSQLQSDCEFDFVLEFAVLGVTQFITIGRFHAPSTGSGTLPIGLCGEDLCSTDGTINSYLQTYNRIGKYNRWKRDYDAKQRRIDTISSENAAVLAQASIPRTSEARDSLVNTDDVELNSTEERVAAAAEAEKGERPLELDEIGDVDKSIEDQSKERDEVIQARVIDDLYATNFYPAQLSAAWADLNVAVQNYMDELKRESRELHCLSSASDISDMCLMNRRAQEAILDYQDQVLSGRFFKQTIEQSARLSPLLGNGISLCEAVTGREFCRPDARRLSPIEIGLAVVGSVFVTEDVLVKLFSKFPGLENYFGKSILSEISEWKARMPQHVIVGEFENDNGRALLKGGLHSQFGLELFETRYPGHEVLHRADSGVRIVAWAEDAPGFTDAQRRVLKNVARGYDVSGKLVKTIYPENWTGEDIVRHINRIRKICGTVSCTGFSDGVWSTIVMRNGVIQQAYPIVRKNSLRWRKD
jgi:hypothetical protein